MITFDTWPFLHLLPLTWVWETLPSSAFSGLLANPWSQTLLWPQDPSPRTVVAPEFTLVLSKILSLELRGTHVPAHLVSQLPHKPEYVPIHPSWPAPGGSPPPTPQPGLLKPDWFPESAQCLLLSTYNDATPRVHTPTHAPTLCVHTPAHAPTLCAHANSLSHTVCAHASSRSRTVCTHANSRSRTVCAHASSRSRNHHDCFASVLSFPSHVNICLYIFALSVCMSMSVSVYTYVYCYVQGFPRWLSNEESFCQCRRCRRWDFDPWVRKIPWSRKWKPTPVFLPGKSHRQRSLAGYSPWGQKRVEHDLATKQQSKVKWHHKDEALIQEIQWHYKEWKRKSSLSTH